MGSSPLKKDLKSHLFWAVAAPSFLLPFTLCPSLLLCSCDWSQRHVRVRQLGRQLAGGLRASTTGTDGLRCQLVPPTTFNICPRLVPPILSVNPRCNTQLPTHYKNYLSTGKGFRIRGRSPESIGLIGFQITSVRRHMISHKSYTTGFKIDLVIPDGGPKRFNFEIYIVEEYISCTAEETHLATDLTLQSQFQSVKSQWRV